MPKRLLVLSVSAGAGHIRAAEALRAQALESHADGVTVKHLDVLTPVPASFRSVYSDFYLRLVERHPALWAYLYHSTDRTPRDALFSQVRRAIERLNTRKLRDGIEAFAPDHVICTHFLPAELLAHEIKRGRTDAPVWVVVTDFDLHRLWVQPGMRGYFAAHDEVAFRMREAGIAAERIDVSGIPIMPAFAKPLDHAACAQELGVDPAKPALLLTSGGAGLGGGEALLKRLLALPRELQIIALAGKNASLLSAYQALARQHSGRVFAVGFTATIERLMAACDLVVTKPGGLTVSECMAMRLPMVLTSPIPGQEERNADFLLESGAALKANDPAGLAYRVDKLLEAPEQLSRMRERLAVLGRPHAARQILERVLRATP